MKEITLEDIREIAFVLAQRMLSFDEPIPDFDSRYPGKLESCIAAPFQTYEKIDLYPTLLKKVGILFYLMNKNHPFQNGNKRIAVMTLFVVLSGEGKWLAVPPKELYDFAVLVAGSQPGHKDIILSFIESFLEKHLTLYEPSKKEN